MQSFKDYVVSEFKIEGTTSISFKFTHSLSAKIDKKTNKMLNNHTINIVVQFFDKDLNSLYRTSFRFVNNVLNKKQAKSLVNISPKELENRFNVARREIVSEIQNDYIQRRNEIDDKINSLLLYENVEQSHEGTTFRGSESHSIIPSEFKGEVIQFTETKPKFDM